MVVSAVERARSMRAIPKHNNRTPGRNGAHGARMRSNYGFPISC